MAGSLENRGKLRELIDKFQFARERYGERMRILYELLWLWETLVIALAAAAVCVVCAMREYPKVCVNLQTDVR